MKFTEAMVYYNFNGSEIARLLGIKRQSISGWKLMDTIPLHHQQTLERLTNGELKADNPDEFKQHKQQVKRYLRSMLINESSESKKNGV